MDKSKRQVVIAGNWKMNKNAEETKALLGEMTAAIKDADCKVLLCVPAINISTAVEATKDSIIEIGAQNCHWAANGAFTGEISAKFLANMGASHVVLGHSERREYFAETDEIVNKKVHAALNWGVRPIVCVGESLEQREAEETFNLVKKQVEAALQGVDKNRVANHVTIAYEPIWAIGTGKTASAEQAEEVCAYVRKVVAELYDEEVASRTRVLYGGSMKAANAEELLAQENIDGGLIGGASLKVEEFTTIAKVYQDQ